MGRSVVWLQFNSLLEFSFGLNSIAIPTKLDKSERGMRFSQTLIHLQRFDGGFLCFRKAVLRLTGAIDNQHVVAVSQSRVSFRVIRISVDCLLEEFDALLQAVSGTFVPRVATF